MSDDSEQSWQKAHQEYLERIRRLKAEPGAIALLRRALIELHGLERDIETVITDYELIHDIEAFLNASPTQDL